MKSYEQADLDNRLIDAAKHGKAEAIPALLADGANVHANDDRALYVAAYDGHTETVKLLLTDGANVHAWNKMVLYNPAYHGHMETVKVLLAAGADVHAHGHVALCWTAYNGHTETVKVLAKHIFSPDFWRDRSRVEFETEANTLYDQIRSNTFLGPIKPERLHNAATILADYALRCWEQIRPAPPQIQISLLPAQPKPL